MNIQDQLKAIADEWQGASTDNRAVVLLTIEQKPDEEKENVTNSVISGVIQGKASLVIDAFQHIIEDERKSNDLGRAIRKAQSRVALNHLSVLLDKLLGSDEKTSEEQREDTEEQSADAATEQGEEASHE